MNRRQLRIFKNPPLLESQGLLLRKISRDDIYDVYDYAKNPSVSKFLLWSPHPNTEHTKRYLEIVEQMYSKGEFYDFAIVLKKENKMIGTCGFTSFDLRKNIGEIGFVLNEKYWGKGYAGEAVDMIIKFARETLKLSGLYAQIMSENEKSKNLGAFE